MTISTQANSQLVAGTGVAISFAFGFIGDSASLISVSYVDSAGIVTALNPSQYSITLNATLPNQLWGIGGIVTYPLAGSPIAAGTYLLIERTLPYTQEVSVRNQGNYYPQVTEQALDILEMQIQQLASRTYQYRGTWVTNTQYNVGDLVIDGASGGGSGNLYLCTIANVSGTWSTDLAAGDWQFSLLGGMTPAPLPLATANGGLGGDNASATGIPQFVNGVVSVTNALADGAAATTQAAADNSTKIATTGFVNGTALTLADGSTAATQLAFDASTNIATTAYVNQAAAPIVGNANNATMTVASASATATFTADSIALATAYGGSYILLHSYSQLINLGATGAGGMDTGSAPLSGFVSLYAIAKADGTTSILACNTTSSSGAIYVGGHMPSGYVYSALISVWPTNGSRLFVVGYQAGRTVNLPGGNNQQVLSGGTTNVATSVSLSSYIPSSAKTVKGYATLLGANASQIGGDSSMIGGIVLQCNSASNGITVQFSDMPMPAAQTIYYQAGASASVSIYVNGYGF